MSTNKDNPYQLDYGYEDNHEQPISGYGITLDSIRHWLFDNDLDCSMTKLLAQLNKNQIEPEYDDADIDTDMIEQFSYRQLPKNEIQYVAGNNIEFEAFMVYDTPVSDEPQSVPGKVKVNAEILQVVKTLFDVPDYETINKSLEAFINKYTDYINVCDYS